MIRFYKFEHMLRNLTNIGSLTVKKRNFTIRVAHFSWKMGDIFNICIILNDSNDWKCYIRLDMWNETFNMGNWYFRSINTESFSCTLKLTFRKWMSSKIKLGSNNLQLMFKAIMLIRWYILKVIKINIVINSEEKGNRSDRIIRLDCACDAKNGYALETRRVLVIPITYCMQVWDEII